APSRDKEVRELSAKDPVALLHVMDEDLLCGGVNWHPAGLAEFGAHNHQHTLIQVHVLRSQVQRLTDAEARYREETEQAVIHQTWQTLHLSGGLEQMPDFRFRVQIWSRAMGAMRHQTPGGDLCCRVCGNPVPSKTSDKCQAARPLRWRRLWVALGPLHRQRDGNVRSALFLQKRSKIVE